MKTSRFNVLLLSTALLLTTGAITAPASAQGQSDGELRRENQRLRTEVDELKKELDAAKEQIKRLEAMIETMRKRGSGNMTPPDPPEKEKLSIDETQPLASPRSVFATIQKGYKETMSEMDMGEEADSRERSRYLSSVEKWIKAATRNMAKPVEWEVTIEETRADKADFALRLQAVDPVHGTKLGEPFWASLKKNRARNLENGLDGEWVVKGRLNVVISINQDRKTAGQFNNPKLIGPFAEYGLQLEIINIVKAEDNRKSSGD